MKCYHLHDKKAGKILIPGCWGAVLGGIKMCTCRIERPAPDDESVKVKALKAENEALQKQVFKLNRIILRLSNGK